MSIAQPEIIISEAPLGAECGSKRLDNVAPKGAKNLIKSSFAINISLLAERRTIRIFRDNEGRSASYLVRLN